MIDLEVESAPFWEALAFAILLTASCIYARKKEGPFLYYSNLNAFASKKKSIRQRLAPFPSQLMVLALAFFLLAYIDPHYYELRTPSKEEESGPLRIPTEGIAIYLVLDYSQSMAEEIQISTPFGGHETITKMNLLKEVTERFVKGDTGNQLRGRFDDLIGIIAFARTAQVIAPLTLDHRDIIDRLRNLKVNQDEDQLGSAIGYAIFKAANLIEATKYFGEEEVTGGIPAYEIKNSIIVLVTDGFQETNPKDYQNPLRSIDILDAVNFAKKQGITLYIVNLDPKINSQEYSQYRTYFELLAGLTGGKFYYVNESLNLQEIYAEIDQLQRIAFPEAPKSLREHMPQIYKKITFYRPLIFLGMASLFLSVVLSATWLRRFP